LKEELHGRIVEEEAKFASLSAEAGSLREQISSLEAQLTRKSDSSNDLKEELLSARRAEEVVKSELAGVCAAKDALARQLDEVRTNLTWETSKASELEEQLSALKSELASARDARVELERELEGARANLAVESSNEHELEEQLSALKSELASARDARVELERELAAMRDGFEAQLEAQKGAGADMKLETEHLEELVAKLKNEIEANSVLRERMQTEKQAEDSYVTALNEEIEALRLELHAAQARAAQALGQYAELDSALPKIIDAVDRLRSLTSMVNEDSPIVEHTFSVADVPPPQPNEFLVIVGSWNDWDLATGVAMSYDPDGSWKALVELQSDIVYEYKVCVCSGSDEERVPQAWQSGANSAFAIASSLINEQGLAPKATVMSHWVADPANAPIMMFGPDGEKFTLSSTQLMTDLPANLITDTLEDLSHVISEVTRGIDNDILNTKQHAATASR
jgi:chromosome segregation ATPase